MLRLNLNRQRGDIGEPERSGGEPTFNFNFKNLIQQPVMKKDEGETILNLYYNIPRKQL
ncbi:MAG: hypothetical protein Q7K55_07745 [Candidatus Levybacteria bacterium]|nr:hypothetical protein [Candidatus Levybacteria bacterium]